MFSCGQGPSNGVGLVNRADPPNPAALALTFMALMSRAREAEPSDALRQQSDPHLAPAPRCGRRATSLRQHSEF
jgi:hypothetical protein